MNCSVAEFLGCWAVGGQATLTLNTINGVTTVSFTTTLPGHPEAPLHPPPRPPAGRTQHPRPRPHHRGPAQRERDRLRAARHQAAIAGAQPHPSFTPPPLAAVPVAPSNPDDEKTTKKVVTHDRFKCEKCGERLDNKNSLTVHMIRKHKEPGEILSCDVCNFETPRKVCLNIHTSKKHKEIEQLDGNDSNSDEVYAAYYWEREQMGTGYQSYLDVIENIESANISKEEKLTETERAMKAREDAFVLTGQTVEYIHSRWPPWSKST